MNILVYTIEEVSVLKLGGRFDSHYVNRVSETLSDIIATSSQIVVDLSDVDFMDSSSLAALVHGMKQCRSSEGDLRLFGLQQPLHIIFELTRLDKAFIIFHDLEQALASFNG